MASIEASELVYVAILAGGNGTRLWPRSRKAHPKQLLDLLSPRTMLQETFARAQSLAPVERILVLTNRDYMATVRAQLPELPPGNVIGEPDGRNTAPSVGLAAVHVQARNPRAILVSLASDHHIQDTLKFSEALRAAIEVAALDCLVTLGIQPTHAETAYGYIECGERLGEFRGWPAYRVRRFTEKPDAVRAAEMVAAGNYYWNAGIFVWKVSTLLDEFTRYQPRTHVELERMAVTLADHGDERALDELWSRLERQPIDTAILEHSDRVAVIPYEGWSDVGSWTTLQELAQVDQNRNVIQGEHIGLDTTSSFVYSPHRLVATIGLSDMIVVDTGDAILICPRSRAQDVKLLVDELRRQERERYL